MAVELNGIVWKKFVEFFRTEKGYEDWTEQEIEDSRNDDDTTEFLEWLVKELTVEALLRHEAVNYLTKDLEVDNTCVALNDLLDKLEARG